ncbi:lipoprotein-releasing ABC transporter permease subunit [Aestuariibacter halophilus]|uniref:Lipoprotein-releasing ABC transporter permease subunit n=1 Tax=Fluctibacter halophilus TaxID=226011 RepID=A0ABS8G5A5_9ALTE|nr:lipoprotein-releasing ABC transporter permease subunit [Aestuariibacter halophilus]MCC2615779.1 lipoprotein-releasing ABC transporter permease subunit [Aestuariibacter halophilus]
MALVWQLAWRLRSSKRQNGFISFISASSTLGIGLGCFVLIVLLSVMNGFERELKQRILSAVPHGEVWAVGAKGLQDWPVLLEQLAKDPRIAHVEPYSKATGMLQKGSTMKAITVTAVDPEYAASSRLASLIPAQQWAAFSAQQNGILLGKGARQKLAVSIGDTVQLLLPSLSDDLTFAAPKAVWLTVVGEISIGGELDNHLALIQLQKSAAILGVETGAQGLRMQFHDPFVAPSAMYNIGYSVKQHVYMSDWTRTQGHLYQDIQLVRSVVYLALTLLIAVACFNIVSTLVMAVSEKRAEVAMLMTLGARGSLITQVFMLQGLINGFVGTLIGAGAGVLVAQNLSDIARGIESVLGITLLSGDIYFIDFLPSELAPTDVVATVLIALSLSVIATVYPARTASKIDPARVL